MKKFFTLGLLVVFTTFFLVGCSNDDTSSEGNDPLTVWAIGGEGEKLAEMAPQFTEATGIEVEVVPIPWDQAHDKLLTAVASQEGPDVVQLGTTWVAEFAEAGALADMSAYAEQYPETFSPDTYFPAAEGYMYYEDAMVAVPWIVDTRVLYYRSDLLAEVGYEEPPTTWEEVYDCATKLVEQDISDYGFYVDSKDEFTYITYAWSYGWTFFDESGNLNFDDPLFQQSIEYYNQFYTNGLAPIENTVDVMTMFADGQIPMFVSGPWYLATLQNDYPELEGKWNVALSPAGTTQTSVMGGSCLAVWEWSDQKDEAAAFIDWVNQPAQQVEFFKLTGSLPSNMAAWEDPSLAEDPYLPVFEAQLQTSQAHPLLSNFDPIVQAMIVEVQEFYYGEQDITATMEDIATVTNKEFAD